MKKLIINADDFGMSSLYNEAILNLCRERELLSVSIMVKRAISSQKNQVTELLNYATMYNDISL
jgi:predicted glycoside hydrolase/deacetylase ChbG (UPF0249 family)